MLADRLAERLAPLRVANGLFERRARDAEPARRDVDPLGFEARHDVLEPFAFHSADQIRRGHGKIVEMQLAGFDSFVAELVDVAADGQARRALSR